MPYYGGGSGGGGGPPPRLSHRHHQEAAATTWIIAHGLGFRPAGIQVTDTDGHRVEGVATHPDEHSTHIHFDVPIRGIADLS